MNEQTWNDAIFDGVEDDELNALNEAMERGDLAEFEPQPSDVSDMTEAETIAHAHATRDAYLEKHHNGGVEMSDEYTITQHTRDGEGYSTMIIRDAGTGDHIAEYRLTGGTEAQEIDDMRRAIDAHLRDGGTLGNYQW